MDSLVLTDLMNETNSRLLLLTLLAAPLFGVVAIALSGLMPNRRTPRHEARNTALAASLLALLLGAAVLAVHWVRPDAIARVAPWGDEQTHLMRSSLAMGVDGISVWLVALTVVLMPLVILCGSHSIRTQTRAYYVLLLLLETAMLGVFVVRDLLWFYIFFEFTLAPLFFLIVLWGGPERRLAAYKMFIYTLAGSTPVLGAILYLGMKAGGFGFDTLLRVAPTLPTSVQWALFVAMFVGFAIKVPLFPFHTWLPLAHTEAPTGGSVLLAGVLLKLGTYGFLRIGIGFLPEVALAAAPWMATLAIVGIVYGALGAYVQNDIKKLVAYSSISHLGACVLGLFTFRPEGMVGSVLMMVNHGLSTGALFLVVGMIYERYHTRQMGEVGGLVRRMPVICCFLVLFALSSMGLPGLNGFVSEVLVLLGTFISGTPTDTLPATLGVPFAAAAALGVILSAVYLLHMVRQVAFGPLVEPEVHDAEEDRLPADATAREWAILAPLAVLVVLLGVWPRPLLDSMSEPIDRMLDHVARHAPSETPQAASAQDPDEPEANSDERDPALSERTYAGLGLNSAAAPHASSIQHPSRSGAEDGPARGHPASSIHHPSFTPGAPATENDDGASRVR